MLNKIVLKIAKNAILSRFGTAYAMDEKKLVFENDFLSKEGASFVTLHLNGNLRGCIGSIIAHQTLLHDIISNAKSAAFRDPRFAPLEQYELENLTIEVSVLSEPELLEYEDFDDLAQKIRPNIDGLIFKYGSYQGTFLPQVWEQLPNPKDFLDHLSFKAGAAPSIYAQHPDIYRYSVEAIEDDFNAIEPF